MMHCLHDHARYTHDHRFLGAGHARAEARAKLVTALTAVFMVVEIAMGWWSGSMALLADGIHMATHAAALGLAALTYMLARRYDGNPHFTFGSGKFGDLTAFASAILMALLALGIAVESFDRLIRPQQIAFGEALVVAAVGLLVNLASAALLHGDHDHHHDHHHDHGHDPHHDHDHEAGHGADAAADNNLRAAYFHVLADALTSVLAIGALAAGWYFGTRWADALAGLVGAGLIASWSWGLLRDSARVLLDVEDDPLLAREIRSWVETRFQATVCDFHLWRLGPGHRGLILSLVGRDEIDADAVKRQLCEQFPGLSHLTVETAVCPQCAPHG